MLAAFAGENTVTLKDMPVPEIREGELLVRVRACGICGSDLEKVYGNYGMASRRIGHEIAGDVAASKSSAFAEGDRVFVHHHVPCSACYYCAKGDYVLCAEYQKSNVDPCGLAERMRVPAANVSKGGVLRIPEGMSYEIAALAEPLACCIKAVNKCQVRRGDTVAVIGCGPAGMMNALLLQAQGGDVIAVDVNEFRLQYARRAGIKSVHAAGASAIKDMTSQRGADTVIVATGSSAALLQAFDIVRKGGTIMLFGVPPTGTELAVDANKLFSDEIALLTSGYCSEMETNAAMKLIARRRIDVKQLITHRFPLAQVDAAFRCAHDAKDAMKVMVTG